MSCLISSGDKGGTSADRLVPSLSVISVVGGREPILVIGTDVLEDRLCFLHHHTYTQFTVESIKTYEFRHLSILTSREGAAGN